jgi:hypothetical protein
MTRTLRLLALAAALPLALSACNTGGKAGDTNVESGSAKDLESNNQPSRSSADNGDAMSQSSANGDSLTAGIPRDTTNRPTGKELFNAADRAKDRNHDGIAD